MRVELDNHVYEPQQVSDPLPCDLELASGLHLSPLHRRMTDRGKELSPSFTGGYFSSLVQ